MKNRIEYLIRGSINFIRTSFLPWVELLIFEIDSTFSAKFSDHHCKILLTLSLFFKSLTIWSSPFPNSYLSLTSCIGFIGQILDFKGEINSRGHWIFYLVENRNSCTRLALIGIWVFKSFYMSRDLGCFDFQRTVNS